MGPSFYHDWSLAPCLILYDIWKRNTAYHYGDFWKQNHAFGDLGCTYLHSSVIWPFEIKSVIMPEWNIFCKKSSLYNFRTFSSLQGKKKKPDPLPVLLYFPSPNTLETTSTFWRYRFAYLDISHKWNHAICAFCVWLLSLSIMVSRLICWACVSTFIPLFLIICK